MALFCRNTRPRCSAGRLAMPFPQQYALDTHSFLFPEQSAKIAGNGAIRPVALRGLSAGLRHIGRCAVFPNLCRSFADRRRSDTLLSPGPSSRSTAANASFLASCGLDLVQGTVPVQEAFPALLLTAALSALLLLGSILIFRKKSALRLMFHSDFCRFFTRQIGWNPITLKQLSHGRGNWNDQINKSCMKPF